MTIPLLVIAALIAVNALYVAAEFSAVATPKAQLAAIAKGGNRRAARLLAVLEDGARLDDTIAACQIGITFTSLVAGAYAQATITFALGPVVMDLFGLSQTAALSVAAAFVLLMLTALQVVIGELVPKSLALQFPERVALATFLPAQWSVTLYRFFIWLLNGSAFLLLKPFGVTPGGSKHVHSPEEIEYLLAASHRGGALDQDVRRRLQGGLKLSNRTARQLMVPRGEVQAIEASASPEEVLEQVLSSPYSRLPVYRETFDTVIGAISTKEFAAAVATRDQIPQLAELVRPIPFVPEGIPADRLVRFLQEARSSKALVVDEFGGVEGIVSIEDVLAEMFEELAGSQRPEVEEVETLPDGRLRLPASMGVDEAERLLQVRWEGSAATVGGHVVGAFERLPQEGETIEIGGVEVTVEEMSPKTIVSVLVRKIDPEEAPS